METSACPEISALSSFVDDELEEIRNKEIELHVRNCRACASQISRFQRADRLIAGFLTKPMTFSDRSNTENCVNPEVMTAYLHDLLPVAEKQNVEEHLDTCDVCLNEFTSLVKATVRLERSNQEPLPDALREKVEALWKKGQTDPEQMIRLVVRLAKDGLSLLRDSLIPSSIVIQEVFAPVGAYRSAERPSSPSGLLLKKSLPGIQLSVLLEWLGENRAGLRIKIEDNMLEPIAGCRLTLRRDEVLVRSERTGADGNITLSDLEAGTYRLAIITSEKEFPIDLKINTA